MKPVQEIECPAPDLVTWGDYFPEVKCECRSAAVLSAAGWVVFDPLPLAGEPWAAVTARAPVAAIVLTSGNHQRASGELKERLAVPVYAPAAARGDLEADHWLEPGAEVHGFRLHALPGGGPGESCWCDGRTLVLGDAIIHLNDLEILPYKYCADAVLLRGSVRGLAGLEFERVVFAHGSPLLVNAHERLSGFVLSS